MAVPKSLLNAKGNWGGSSQLNQPWLPEDQQLSQSESTLTITTDANEAFATLNYTWQHEGKEHFGSMLVSQASESSAVEIAWVDSWHQSEAVLHLKGEVDNEGKVKGKGVYMTEPETWAWTISLELNESHFHVEMENVLPSGEAQWAVRGVYSKT